MGGEYTINGGVLKPLGGVCKPWKWPCQGHSYLSRSRRAIIASTHIIRSNKILTFSINCIYYALATMWNGALNIK